MIPCGILGLGGFGGFGLGTRDIMEFKDYVGMNEKLFRDLGLRIIQGDFEQLGILSGSGLDSSLMQNNHMQPHMEKKKKERLCGETGEGKREWEPLPKLAWNLI